MSFRPMALLAGPVLFLLIALLPAPAGMSGPAKLTAAITVWMAVWWISDVVHVAVTALLPLVLFPVMGILALKNTAAEYSNEIIYLFVGGFIFGKAIERWQLHRRVALGMVLRLGSRPENMLLGFMLATAFISMWISNTATAIMMTPVAIAVVGSQSSGGEGQPSPNFAKALLLGVGYACSIGGLGSLVGTPTNGIFVSFVHENMHASVSFVKWLVVGFPVMLLLLFACWRMLLWLFPVKNDNFSSESYEEIRREKQSLGPLSRPEIRLLVIFGAVVTGWVTGSLIWYQRLGWSATTGDTIVAITGAIILFLVPPGKAGTPALLDWRTAERIPWGVVVLFGGGLALAKAFDQSGLAVWLGALLEGLNTLPKALILLAVLSLVVVLSEIASNIATASMMMPVLAALASGIGMHPFGLLITAAMAASVGFALPVATAPNSIVYASGYLSTRDMARAGFLLDIIAVLLLMAAAYLLLPLVWGINM